MHMEKWNPEDLFIYWPQFITEDLFDDKFDVTKLVILSTFFTAGQWDQRPGKMCHTFAKFTGFVRQSDGFRKDCYLGYYTSLPAVASSGKLTDSEMLAQNTLSKNNNNNNNNNKKQTQRCWHRTLFPRMKKKKVTNQKQNSTDVRPLEGSKTSMLPQPVTHT